MVTIGIWALAIELRPLIDQLRGSDASTAGRYALYIAGGAALATVYDILRVQVRPPTGADPGSAIHMPARASIACSALHAHHMLRFARSLSS